MEWKWRFHGCKGRGSGHSIPFNEKVQLVSNFSAVALDARGQGSNDFNSRMFCTVKLLNVSRREQRNRERD